MIESIVVNEMCCGCGACFNTCPVNAIQMHENKNGFIQPYIDNSTCIRCGLCEKVCPSFSEKDSNRELHCYAIKLNDRKELCESQSGGAFFAIAMEIIRGGGVVYGMANNDIRDVSTHRVDMLEDLHSLQKSKYVQGRAYDSFKNVKDDLEKGLTVLYSGTACVVQGLINYLDASKTDRRHLLTCDLICHGVPSRMIDRDFLNRIEKKHHSKVISFLYRDKTFGWGTHIETATLESGEAIHSNDKVIIFSKGYSVCPSCFKCRYTTPYRHSDFTIGDFWGLDRIGMDKRQFSDGLSSCVVRNTMIDEMIERLTSEKVIQSSEVSISDVMQWNFEKATARPEKYDKFWNMYQKNRFKTMKPVFFALSNQEKIGRMIRMVKNLLNHTWVSKKG